MAQYERAELPSDLSKADRLYRAHQKRFRSFDDPWACVAGVAAARRDATVRIAGPRSREKAPTIQRFPPDVNGLAECLVIGSLRVRLTATRPGHYTRTTEVGPGGVDRLRLSGALLTMTMILNQ